MGVVNASFWEFETMIFEFVVLNLVPGTNFSLNGQSLNFSSSDVLFEQAYWFFDFWDQDFWIPRIAFGTRTHFQPNRTMFNFSSSDVLFEQPFSFLVSGTMIFEFLVLFLVPVTIFSLIEGFLIFHLLSFFLNSHIVADASRSWARGSIVKDPPQRRLVTSSPS